LHMASGTRAQSGETVSDAEDLWDDSRFEKVDLLTGLSETCQVSVFDLQQILHKFQMRGVGAVMCDDRPTHRLSTKTKPTSRFRILVKERGRQLTVMSHRELRHRRWRRGVIARPRMYFRIV
jgi:predicted ATP-grasp superfamily ATP-dependent carboligase